MSDLDLEIQAYSFYQFNINELLFFFPKLFKYISVFFGVSLDHEITKLVYIKISIENVNKFKF